MESGDTIGQSQTEKCVVPILFPDWKWEEKANSNSTATANCDLGEYDGLLCMVCWFPTILLHQQIEMWGNMMVCCTWFAGFQPFYYISKLICGGILWFAGHMVCWLPTILLHQQIEMWGNMMVCCTWFVGFQPLFYIRKLRCGRIWWFAAHRLLAFSHSTTSANCDEREYDGLLHMVCWQSSLVLFQ